MLAHRIETTVPEDGKLTLESLPFAPGEPVEIIVLSSRRQEADPNPYPLRGTPLRYAQPFVPVADEDWNAAA